MSESVAEYLKWVAETPPEVQAAYVADKSLKDARASGTKTSTKDLQKWWTSVYGMWQSNPTEFQKWAATDPNMATRWYALAQNKGQSLTRGGTAVSAKELQAENMDLLQSAGVDLKNNGQLYTTNFKTVADVNNNWGAGDFWKIGSYNTPQNGVEGTLKGIAESPAAIAAIVAMVAAPYLAGALAPALGAVGLTGAAANTAAASIISAGMSAAQGGDFSDIVTAGLTAALPGLAQQYFPRIIGAIDARTGEILNEKMNSLTTATPGTVKEAQSAWDKIPNIMNLPSIPVPNSQQPTGVQYDMPILNPVVAVPSPEGASGGSQNSGGATTAPPATPVPPAAPNAPQGPTGAPAGGIEAQERYTWNGTDLINVVTGVKAPRPPDGKWRTPMNKGVVYNAMGEPVGGDEKSGLDLGYLIWANQQAQNGNQGGGGLVLGPSGTPNPAGPGAGPGPGGVGQGTGPGTSPGTGSGPGPGGSGTGQNGTGTGSEPPPGPDFDWTKLIPLLAAVPQENNEGVPKGKGQPQDMSTLYQKPTYAPVEQKGLLEPYGTRYTRQAPSVLPAENSNQDTFQKWYVDWLRGQNPETGLLPQVSPSTRGLV